MLFKIKRKDCFDKFPKFPKSNNYREEFFFPKCYKGYTLTLDALSLKGHIKLLSEELTSLVGLFGYDTLIFLGDAKNPWLWQDNDYKPVKEALHYLKVNKISRTFNGGIKVGKAELPTFLKHLTWLVRCNSALPDFYFMDEGQNIVGNICKYANIHLFTVNELTDKIFSKNIKSTRLESTGADNCYNKYYKSGAIPGRQTIIR
ncbi:MAG: hypothetical protein ABI666_11865 [Ferruginibacter sp.]